MKSSSAKLRLATRTSPVLLKVKRPKPIHRSKRQTKKSQRPDGISFGYAARVDFING